MVPKSATTCNPIRAMGYDWHVNRVTVTALLRLNRPINGTTAVFENLNRFVKSMLEPIAPANSYFIVESI